MATPDYHCQQQELYTICQMAWKSCKNQLTRFGAFKAKYTAAFIDAEVLLVKAAKQLPDEQSRNEAAESSRIELVKKGNLCLSKWQNLKRYIADAWAKDLQKPKLEAAGSDYYLKASQENWESMNGLITSGMKFIDDNLTALKASNNMPDTFQGEFQTLKEDFELEHETFLGLEEADPIAAEEKVKANNVIHENLMKMLLDGQEIFKEEEALQKQFIFANLLYLASGAGTAGVKGQITDELTAATLEGIKVTIATTDHTTTSIEKGHYEIIQVASGTYNIIFEGTGYETLTVNNWEVKTGTVSTLDVKLKPTP